MQPALQGGLQGSVGGGVQGGLGVGLDLVALLVHGQAHAQGVFGVVLEEGVGQGRAVTGGGLHHGNGGHGQKHGLGAAGGVGDVHPLAEQLGHQLHVGGLAAAGAGTGKLHQRPLELAAPDGELVQRIGLLGEGQAVIPVVLLRHLGLQRLHHQGLLPGGAHVGAAAAALAVQGIHLDAEGIILHPPAVGLVGDAAGRGLLRLLLGKQEGPEGGVGAHQGALVAADAVPDGAAVQLHDLVVDALTA